MVHRHAIIALAAMTVTAAGGGRQEPPPLNWPRVSERGRKHHNPPPAPADSDNANGGAGGGGDDGLTPIVLIPGFPACMIEFNMPPGTVLPPGYSQCRNETNGWEALSPPPTNLTLDQVPCWLLYVGVRRNASAAAGVSPLVAGLQTRVVDVGGFDGMILDAQTLPAFEAAGYTVGKTLFGAPYDWRLPASAQPEFVSSLQGVVENASAANGGRRVALLSVSYGPAYVLAFLHRMPQAWKDQHVSQFVAEAPIWGGAPSSLFLYVSGFMGFDNGTSLGTEIARAFARESAVPWSFPRAGNASKGSWTPGEPLAVTESRTYSAEEYIELLKDLGVTDDQLALAEWLWAEPDLLDFEPPGVDTLVACGVGVTTPSNATFATGLGTHGDWELRVLATNNDGDGLAPARSCLRPFGGDGSSGNHSVTRTSYQGLVHATCLHSDPTNATAPNSRCFADVMQRINGGNVRARQP